MVNNNNYPVEIPKTYTVSYFDEAEGNKDLTPAEIAQQQEIADWQNQLQPHEKVYGPCKICRKPTEGTDLYIKCPASGCPSSSESRSYWYHKYCGGHAKISNKATLSCSRCSSQNHMSKWNFRCSEHTGETVESIDYDSFTKCLGLAMQNRDCGQVIKDLGIYISNHEEEGE